MDTADNLAEHSPAPVLPKTKSSWGEWALNVFMLACLLSFLVVATTVARAGFWALYERLPWFKKTSIEQVFGKCGTPCIVHNSPGGDALVFATAAASVRRGDLVIIDGNCSSACSVFADFARPNVCITRKAAFGFHQGVDKYSDGSKVYHLPIYSLDIMRYVVAEGGFPNTDHGEELLVMRYPDTMRFWPICKSDGIVLQKADRLVPREGNAVVELPMPRPRPQTMARRR
ncbi:MAG TPA: hypothetical protein VJJ20_03955 [Candidatus Paceibacterota bacterium]